MIYWNDNLCPDCRSQLSGLCGHRRHGFVRECSRRRGDNFELGLTKDEVIITGREREVSGDVFLSTFHSPDAPGSVRRRFLSGPEDLASEERRGDLPDWDDPVNRAEQYDIDNSAQKEDRITGLMKRRVSETAFPPEISTSVPTKTS